MKSAGVWSFSRSELIKTSQLSDRPSSVANRCVAKEIPYRLHRAHSTGRVETNVITILLS